VELYASQVGVGTPRVVFLHGLFGQGKNWRAVAKGLGDLGPSLLVDLPNHGRSPWTTDFGYAAMADAVAEDLRRRLGAAASVVLVGHSMGGKTAMALALRHPRLLRGLVVADIAPDDSSHGYGFGRLVAALRALDLGALTQRADADARLARSIPDAAVRAFLLQNLHRGPGGWSWQPNLALIAEALPLISGWPGGVRGTYTGPVLWLRGSESGYVQDEHIPVMRSLFPRVRLQTIAEAGHWLHADQPKAVTEAIADFLRSLRPALAGGPVGPVAVSR